METQTITYDASTIAYYTNILKDYQPELTWTLAHDENTPWEILQSLSAINYNLSYRRNAQFKELLLKHPNFKEDCFTPMEAGLDDLLIKGGGVPTSFYETLWKSPHITESFIEKYINEDRLLDLWSRNSLRILAKNPKFTPRLQEKMHKCYIESEHLSYPEFPMYHIARLSPKVSLKVVTHYVEHYLEPLFLKAHRDFIAEALGPIVVYIKKNKSIPKWIKNRLQTRWTEIMG
jgi:hypothetical protein